MAVDKITFADKVSMIESTLPVINRIRDIDVNEIKDVVNNNADELTTTNTTITSMNKIDDFASKVTFSETPANYSMKAKNGVAYIEYNGATKAHTLDTVLFTIPSGYRPGGDIFTPSIQGIKYARVWIRASDGTVRISSVSSTTDTSRISFTISYLIGN